LLGLGGLSASGGWHSAGRPTVYSAEHPALALVEILIHSDRANIPSNYQLLKIELPDDAIGQLHEAVLDDPAAARPAGDVWLASCDSLALRVPSFVAPHSWNYLINPSHSRIAGIRVLQIESWPFDRRLFD
jgi:RES domain-containing protein